jgi:hypothetical protein
VKAPAAALVPAVKVTLCAVPGVRFSVAGLAVTPAGRPLIATETVPVNEFSAVAVTLTWEPAAPGVSVSDAGDTASVKSGGGAGAEMVAATVTEWLSIPDVPVRVNVALLAAALAAALIVTLCAVPGVKVSVAGCAVTPVGNPVIATFTSPAKPFAGTAFTLICCPAPPGASVTSAGEEVRLKSPSAVGLEPPPHDTNTRQKRKLEQPARVFEKAPMSPPKLCLNLLKLGCAR